MAVVYQYGAPPLPFGAIDAITPGQFPVYEGLAPSSLGAHVGMSWLLVASPFNPASVTSPTIYPAATISRSSTPTDTPANTYVPGKLTGDVPLAVSVFAGADPLAAGTGSFGELELLDVDGALDSLLALGWDNATIELRRGLEAEPFSQWTTVARLTSAGIIGGLRSKRFRLRDLAWRLASAELHGERYGGTGGNDGDAALKGRLKPYAAGYVFNITPVVINTAALILQVSRSSITAITEVRDGGVPLTQGTNHATYALLAAAAVSGGTYATCLAEGLFRLGSTPALEITADVTGDADSVNGLGAPLTRGRIVRRIATGIGTVSLTDSEQIDHATFQSFENKQPAAVGWYWDGRGDVTKAQAIAEVMGGCCGWWTVRPNGQLTIGQIEDPADSSPTFILSFPAASAGEVRLGEPEITDILPPRRATYIGWKRNYTIQTRGALAGAVSEANAQLYSQESKYAGEEAAYIAAHYPSSPAVTLAAGYRLEADATAEATRQTNIFDVERRRYAVPIAVCDPVADVVGQYARLDNLNRLGWGAAKSLFVCGFNGAGGNVELHFWG